MRKIICKSSLIVLNSVVAFGIDRALKMNILSHW